MTNFLIELKQRNETLYYFGVLCGIVAVVCLCLTQLTATQVYNVNAWYKPFKFAVSTMVYAWAMAWYVHYLPKYDATWFNWSITILLGLEIAYIALQAGRGQLSHYNASTPLYSIFFTLMGVAASAVAIYTAYIGVLFFKNDVAALPDHYLWAIRAGIFIFVVFAFQGFLMATMQTHTIGGADGGAGLPITAWSTRFGDPRIAHFIGMHALQVLPIVSFYALKSLRLTFVAILLYLFLAVFSLAQAIQGKPFFG